MDHPTSEPGNFPHLWDRLRENLERLRTAIERKADPEARAEKLAARARQVRHQVESGEGSSALLYFLGFRKGRERYGIPLEKVLEVQALEQFSLVPGAPSFIRGVVHWRGAILALLDLTRLFEVAEPGLSDMHAYVVVEACGKRIAVAAAQVVDIATVPHNLLKPPPQLPPKIAPEWVLGVYDKNLLILQLDEILRHLEQYRTK